MSEEKPMTVGGLIEKLKAFESDLPVHFNCCQGQLGELVLEIYKDEFPNFLREVEYYVTFNLMRSDNNHYGK